MAEMTILVTQLVVEFAKHLPGFTTLDKEDQIILLKVCPVYCTSIFVLNRLQLCKLKHLGVEEKIQGWQFKSIE